eukprot:CAMPEP_0197601624 /NCGR_PEP_ID=MMETSP1326-20131121/35637_1 /TAXON_ID=1155430 /ORGANISM="Genus nov. species nov., Strain RCC2288" /LENGTH=33 /DNA_ID= /DNA_START= /DNA_END= /DNA_ORIENTATION=
MFAERYDTGDNAVGRAVRTAVRDVAPLHGLVTR